MMPVKNIVIPLNTGYLNEAAKARGVSRTMMVRIIMERIIEKKMVGDILGYEPIIIARPGKYRRFAPKV